MKFICQQCHTEFEDIHFKKNRKYCGNICAQNATKGRSWSQETKDKIRQSNTGKKFGQARKDNISLARTIIISEEQCNEIMEIWKLRYVQHYPEILKRMRHPLSSIRVYRRFFTQNEDMWRSTNPLIFVPLVIQQWPVEQWELFVEELRTVPTWNIIDKYGMGKKSILNLLSKLELKWIKDPKCKSLNPYRTKRQRMTWIECAVKMVLISLQLEFTEEFWVDDKYRVDFLLKDNLIIECNGDYWHANPEIYKKPNKTQIKKLQYDKERLKYMHNKGYKVLIIWEKEIKEDQYKVIERIKNVINN